MSQIPWVDFGLAGLFGVFAIYLTNRFLQHIDKQDERWSVRIDTLTDAIQALTSMLEKMKGE